MAEHMDLIVDVENQLGWTPTGSGSIYKRRAAAVGRLKNALDKCNPPITVPDLRVALAYLVKKRHTVKQPTELIGYVREAKELVGPTLVTDIEVSIAEAMEFERQNPTDDSDKWISKFCRAVGPYRREVLHEWRETRGA